MHITYDRAVAPIVNAPSASYVVLGAGGHAASVADVIASTGGRVVLFAGDPGGHAIGATTNDDASALAEAAVAGHRVVVGIGDNARRRAAAAQIAPGLLAAAIVAATASVAESAQLGDGTVVHHQAHVGPRAVVGSGVIVNTAAVVEHDCVVGPGAHLAPGAVILGDVKIGSDVLVGSGARVLPGVTVGDRSIVGAGAVVTEDVPADVTVIGIPAVRSEDRRG